MRRTTFVAAVFLYNRPDPVWSVKASARRG
jgi:hypothetical protein